MDLAKDMVLDFSYLDESAKTFYAEIALRQIWSSLTGRLGAQEKRRTLIVIDEVHRLTQLYEMEARTIVDTLMRQVRQFGALYTATQNYSDIPDRAQESVRYPTDVQHHIGEGFGGDT